jgi:hypothetical protein
MFGGVDHRRPTHRERCANAICADRRLAPIRARHEMDALPLIEGLHVPDRIKDDPICAREDHD